MENFILLVNLSEDILVLFIDDDNYHKEMAEIMEQLQRKDPEHFRDVQLRILISLLASVRVAFLNTFVGGHMCHEVDAALCAAEDFARQHMSPQYRQGL